MRKNRTNNYNSKPIQGASVFVKNDDVNGALRKLKKILEADNRQKDLARHEFHEKNSTRRKRARDQAKKRSKRERQSDIVAGTANRPTGLKWMKSKRKRRKIIDADYAFNTAKRKNSTR